MTLKTVHDKIDEIPEEFRSLYTEKAGKFELTGIAGVKTEADTMRLQKSLEKERNEHKATRDKLQLWGELDHADVLAKLDRLPELEAAAKGKLDEAQIEEIVAKRVEGTVRSKLMPVERQVSALTKERDELLGQNKSYAASERRRKIHDTMRAALREEKTVPHAEADALLFAEAVMEVAEDGAVLTREGAGLPAGLDAKGMLEALRESRPHWWPPTQGGGARGAGGGGVGGGKNPWSHDGWNLTEQGKFLREHGREKAEQAAKAAGTVLGGRRPVKAAK